ncbi:MAG: uL15m family ribosomal protein, partial [Pseudomonadota bacterium]
WFEGGQMPINRRLPKRGFNNPFAKHYSEVSLGRLQVAIDAGKIDAGQPITEAVLKDAGLFKKLRDGVRILGGGEFSAKVSLEVTGASKPAIAAVEAAGGGITVATPAPAEKSEDA